MLSDLQSRPWNMQLGVTLLELLVAFAVFAILIAAGAPSLRNWLQSAEIRTGSESIVNGLQLARAEAVHRNNIAEFVLCGTDSSWDVLAYSAAGHAQACGADSASTTGWERVQSRSGSEGSTNAKVAATSYVTTTHSSAAYNALTNPIKYDGLGRLDPIQPYEIHFDVTNPIGGTCMPNGPMRCMRIVVSTGGQARMCNPAYTIATNPQGC